MKNIKLGLIPKLILAIALGIICGHYLPESINRIPVTFSRFFGQFLSFVIPLMIVAFVTKGIADLGEGAGKLLAITVAIAYSSTLIGGSLSYFMASSVFTRFVTPELVSTITESAGRELAPYFSIEIKPFFDVTGAIVFAFMFGICISWLRRHGRGETTYKLFTDLNEIITKVLSAAIIPLLPWFIFGNFVSMTYSGSVMAVMNIFWKIFICIIILHLLYVCAMFIVAALYTRKNPLRLIRNQVRGYLTAVGTQSSAATIPVNLECAARNGVSKEIREFVVPLCATVHLPGSMITLTSCVFTILIMFGLPHSYGLFIQFIAVLGIAMVAAPGAPGGAVVSALPFVTMVGIAADSPMASLLITLYITQDSFGTAANVSGDNAIAVAMDKIYHKYILRGKPAHIESEAR